MDTAELLWAKRQFKGRLSSLGNDTKRAFHPIEGVGFSPFPAAMYAFATVDYFSSFWAGWNDTKNRPKSDKRPQTKRMADFLEKYLLYPQKESQIAIAIWRHKLMHTGEPRLLKENKSQYNWSIGDQTADHWTLKEVKKEEYVFYIGLFDLSEDLREGIFGPAGYYEELRASSTLQGNWERFKQEIETYTFTLQT